MKKNTFYKFTGFATKTRMCKPLFFYHVPKCAGSTFSVILSHFFRKSFRIKGSFFDKNDKGGVSAYNFFLKNKKNIILQNYDFIYGHVPIDLHKYFNKKFFFVSLIRDPVERTLSHFNWALNRKYISKSDNFEKLLLSKKIPSNIIVDQFSGKYLKKNIDNFSLISLAEKNIINNLDLLFDVKDIDVLLNFIISYYNLPNIFFQNQNVSTINKYDFTSKQVNIVKKYNELDIELYYKFSKKNLKLNKITNEKEECSKCNGHEVVIKKKKYYCANCYSLINQIPRNIDSYLYSSPNILLNNKKTSIIKKEKLKNIESELSKNKIKILTNG